MKTALAALALLAILTACEGRRGEDTARVGGDTIVTQQTESDTAVVTQDTTVNVDTARVGGGETREDTLNR
jgi:hypothetical protein